MNSFHFADLLMMYRSKGLRLPIAYLRECWWFDKSRGVSTHERMEPADFLTDIQDIQQCVIYMASWTSVVKSSMRLAISHVARLTRERPVLVDVGSGKGKAVIAWGESRDICDASEQVIGVEFSPVLFEICKNNLVRIKNLFLQPDVLCADVLSVNFSMEKPHIFYLYNPFDGNVLGAFAEKIKSTFNCGAPVMIVYNNPVHHEVFETFGFDLVSRKDHWHPNGRVNYYLLANGLKG